MLTSEHDHRHYLPLTLDNGLSVLLVQDTQCRKSAVSATVGAGHFNDPVHCQGSAHLLEHMLFLGSKGYPQPNGLSQFLSEHGGNINAWTATEYSSFHFEVTHDALAPSIEQFADMLANPLFDESLIDKEIQAIDAEFKLKQKDDLRRLYQVHKETCNPAHPFSKFSVGNEQTLRSTDISSLRNILVGFHQDYYKARNVSVCVISPFPHEDVRALLEAHFCVLSSAEKLPEKALPPLYLPEQLAVKIEIRPIKQARRLILSFALPDTQAFYRTKPVGLISHILGDEGSGSLLAYFKQQNWATSLSAGGGIQGANFKDFNLNLQLTEHGLDSIDDILNSIFYHLNMIREHIDEPWRFLEKKRLSKLAFDFSDAVKPLDEAIHLSNQMFFYPTEHIVAGDYLHDRLDMDVVKHCLSYMNPQNMRVKVIHPQANVTRKAQWYDTPYSMSKLPDTLLSALASPAKVEELSLPDPNPFIVKDTHLQAQDERYEYPNMLINQKGLDLWFAQDHRFMQPKGDCFLSFDCAVTAEGAELATYKRLWVAVMMEHFNNHFYQAGVAGLHYHLYPHQVGFSLHTNGFSQKQLSLCQALFEQLHDDTIQADYFARIKTKHRQALQNTLLNKPVNQLFSRLAIIMQRYSYAPGDMLNYVESATPENLAYTRDKLFSEYYLEAFIHGDWRPEQAKAMGEFLNGHMSNVQRSDKMTRDVADLRAEQSYIHQVAGQHDDAAVVVYFQCPGASTTDIAMAILIEQLIAGPFFHTIRTEKQLGYLVGSGYMPYNQHPGIALYIQSPNTPSADLVNEIQAFLNGALADLNVFSNVWQQVKSSVIKQLAENDTNLSMKSQRLWMAIGNGDTDFSLQNKLSEAVLKIELEQLQAFCTKLLNRDGFGEVQLFCPGKFPDNVPQSPLEITDLNVFKRDAKYTI